MSSTHVNLTCCGTGPRLLTFASGALLENVATIASEEDGLIGESYDSRYLEGIRWFNKREFFQAHEAWEGLWLEDRGPSRKFYQGLIQVAVCLHHFRRGNTRGARKLYHTSRAYLQDYRPKHLGLDLDALCAGMQACCQTVIDSEEYFPTAKLDPDLIPSLLCDLPAAQDDAAPESPE